MDHRFAVRLPLRFTVEVFKQERFLGRYITRNMDVEGVFIEMRPTDLKPNEVVKLNFFVSDCEHCDYTFIAGVIRVNADGAGMMLIDYEHKVMDILRVADRLNHPSVRRSPARLESTNTDDYGYAVK